MRMYDIILDKRSGKPLTDEQIRFFVRGVTDSSIGEGQIAALMMAVYFKGMDRRETAALTDAMARSGDMVDLSAIPGVKVDKHSTGGVGDKTSLIVGPIVAACGVPVAKMSGRGLGHTGGTLDKLESIPGMRVDIGEARFLGNVREIGLSIIGQTADIAPADKRLYALRDITATVDNISLIASSIMSKKLASGADAILLDVKAGSGAFMQTLEEAAALAQEMVEIGERMGRRTVALITDMDRPLGYAIGNALEVEEAVATLRGKGPEDLHEICLQLAANMLCLAGKGELSACRALASGALASGAAYDKLRGMVAAQGGDPAALDDTHRLPHAPVRHTVVSPRAGYITHMQTDACGVASCVLGAGREKVGDTVDSGAGLVLCKKTGDRVAAGEPLAVLYTSRGESIPQAEALLLGALAIGDDAPGEGKLVHARVDKDGIAWR